MARSRPTSPAPGARRRRCRGMRTPAEVCALGLLLALLPLAAGCTFDQEGLSGRVACQTDRDCLGGWLCLDGRCYRSTRGAWDLGAGARDLGGPARPDLGGELDSGEPEPTALGPGQDLGPAPRDAGPADGGAERLDQGPGPPDQGPGPPDEGPLQPDQGPQLCGARHCGAQEICNPHSECVPAHGQVDYCRACLSDAECGGPKGVCFGSRYQDEMGFPVEGPERCLAACVGPADCPQGMRCQTYQREGLRTGVCVPRTTTCEAWEAFGLDCSLIYDECPYPAFCSELEPGDWQIDSGCSYLCGEDADCPLGARCEDPLNTGLGACVYA